MWDIWTLITKVWNLNREQRILHSRRVAMTINSWKVEVDGGFFQTEYSQMKTSTGMFWRTWMSKIRPINLSQGPFPFLSSDTTSIVREVSCPSPIYCEFEDHKGFQGNQVCPLRRWYTEILARLNKFDSYLYTHAVVSSVLYINMGLQEEFPPDVI